jgi:chemotaxis protein MotB
MKNLKSMSALAVGGLMTLASCVSKGKLVASQQYAEKLRTDSAQMADQIQNLNSNLAKLQAQINALNGDKSSLQEALNQTQQNASKISGQLNQSKEQIAEQQAKLAQLQALIDQQRKNTEALRKKISDALNDFSSDQLTVSMKDGKVYVSLSENLLFPSGSAIVNTKGKEALGTLASVLNANKDINVEIEGHTDSIPIRGRYEDNWALSVARSTAIVRILTATYKVDPIRVTASGRSSYDPVDVNFTSQGRAHNRRTEIILQPKLDELMKLIETGGSQQQPPANSTGNR